ncbi:MAG: SprT-like domain-containing protein [Verrucomicrobia bacterium]|nr:SprT-like domain-containing protein [Verrucomicrobiota bacterium]
MSLMRLPQQLWLSLTGSKSKVPAAPKAQASVKVDRLQARAKRDAALETQAREWLIGLGLDEGAKCVRVEWNARMRSTAGYAKWPQWVVELNPRLKEFDGQIERTLKHELAHLIAYARAGRRRIKPHGAEWRRACVDLAIPNERVSHTMPLPRHKQRRKYSYVCPACGTSAERVRKFKRHSACLACCKKHNGGRYDARFQFVMKPSEPTQAATPSSSA